MASSRLSQLSFSPTLRNVRSAGDMDAHELAGVASGHAALDRQLPGNGWPEGGVVEVLQDRPEDHVWRLLLPGLASAVKAHAGPVVLINAPREPFGPAMRAQGVPAGRLLSVKADKPSALLWATEQALRCAGVAAVLAWLPKVKSAELRRLHLASCQQERMFFVFRPLHVQGEASPARLRVRVEMRAQASAQAKLEVHAAKNPQNGQSLKSVQDVHGAQVVRNMPSIQSTPNLQATQSGQNTLSVHILKRRGPPLASPVLLTAQSGRLAELLQARRGRPPPAQAALPSSPLPPLPPLPFRSVSLIPPPDPASAAARTRKTAVSRSAHALDRIALPG